MSKQLLVTLAFGLGVACASRDDSSEEFRSALSDIRLENEQHATRCTQSGSMSAVADELERHESRLPTLLERLDAGFSNMAHCFHGDAHAMRSMMSGLRIQDAAHRTNVLAAPNPEAAATECRNYAASIRQDLDHMDGMMQNSRMDCMMM